MPTKPPTWDETEPIEAPTWDETSPMGDTGDGGLAAAVARAEQSPEALKARAGRSYMAADPEALGESMRELGGAALRGGEAISSVIHPIMDVAERVGSTALKPIGGLLAPIRMALGQSPMTAFSTPAVTAGESVIPGLTTAPEDVGTIASLRRAGAGFTTPGSLAMLPLAPGSKAVQGMFGAGAVASIPESLRALTQAQTGAEVRGAITDLGVSTAIAAGIGHSLTKGGQNARRVPETAEVYGDVREQPIEGTWEMPAQEGGARVQPPDARPQAAPTQEVALDASSDRLARSEWDILSPQERKAFAGEDKQWWRLSDEQKVSFARRAGAVAEPVKADEMPPLYEDQPAEQVVEEAPKPAKIQYKLHGKRTFKAKDTQMALSPEHQTMIDEAKKGVTAPVVVRSDVPIVDENEPFAKRRGETRESRDIARANRSNGQIEIYPDTFAAWLDEDLAHMSPEQKQAGVNRLMGHERIHLAVAPSAAETYWRNLTRLEQKIFERIYHGKEGRPSHFSDQLSGDEALRYRIQQLDGMTPDEIAQAIGTEKWTLKSLAILETAIRGARTFMETDARTAQKAEELAILDRVQNNISLAKTMVGGGPAAIRPKRERDWEPEQRIGSRTKNQFVDSLPEVVSKQQWDRVRGALESWSERAAQKTGFKYPVTNDENATMLLHDLASTPEKEWGWVPTSPDSMMGEIIPFTSSERAAIDNFWEHTAGTPHGRMERVSEAIEFEQDPARREQLGKFRDALDLKESGGPSHVQGEFPAAIRRNRSTGSQQYKKRMEDMEKLEQLRKAAAAGEEPPKIQVSSGPHKPVPVEERVSTEELGASPRLTPNQIEAKAKQYLESEIAPKTGGRKQPGAVFSPELGEGGVEWQSSAPTSKAKPVPSSEAEAFREFQKGRTKGYDRASFAKFMDWGTRNIEGVQPEQLRDVWIDSVWNHVLNAPGARLAEWRKALRLEGAFGKVDIADKPTSVEAQEALFPGTGPIPAIKRTERAFAEAKQRYRNKVASAVARQLIKESVKGRADIERTDVGVDDIAFNNAKTKYGAFRQIRPDEASRPEVLNSMLRDEARATEADVESASRRLVLLLDKSTGKAHLVSTYNDAGQQMVTDPAGPRVKGKFSRHLDSNLLKHYQPVATVLLKEPIKAFRRQFDSTEHFMEQMGSEAEARSTIGDFPTEGSTEGFYAEGTEGLKGEGGTIQGPSSAEARALMGMTKGTLEGGRNMTDAEAAGIYRHIKDESGTIESAQDVQNSLAGLVDRAARKKLTPSDRVAISAYRKAFAMLEGRYQDMSREELLDVMAKKIYDNYASSKDAETLVARTLAEFEAENPRATESEPRPSETARELEIEPRSRPIPGARNLSVEGVRGENAQTRLARDIANERQSRERIRALEENIRAEPSESPSQRQMLEGARLAEEGRQEAALEGPDVEGENPAARRRKLPKKIAGWFTDAIRGAGSLYDEQMLNRIARKGGENAKMASEVFKGIVDREKQLYGALATSSLDKAKVAAGATRQTKLGQVPTVEGMKATKWLHETRKVTPWAAVSNTVDAIEGGKVPAFAQKLVDLARDANLDIGRMLQSVIPGFQATGKFARNMTAHAYDLLRRGEGPEFDRWVQGLAKANRGRPITIRIPTSLRPVSVYISERSIRSHFKQIKRVLDDPLTTAEKLDRVNQDMARFYPNVITHVRGKMGWEQVVHSDLFNYLENAARRATHIRAFREAFPATDKGRARLTKLTDAVRDELDASGQADYNGLLRTLQGHPTDNYAAMGEFGPTGALGAPFRVLNQTVGNLLSKLVLTGQVLTQTPELLVGSAPQMFGMRNYVRALAKAKQIYGDMENTGSVNRVMYDMSFDPNSPIRSLFRQAGNTISKTFVEQALNEWQEAAAAATARVVSERIKKGDLTDWERRNLPQTFKEMGFKTTEIGLLMSGDQQMLNQFERMASSFITGGNKALSEGSRLGANRLANSIFRFQLYPMTKMNQLRQVAGNWSEAFLQGGSAKERLAASERMARFVAYNTLQGALTVALVTAGYQWLAGEDIKAHEVADEPFQFLLDSFGASMSGPLYLLLRGGRDKGVLGIGENATRMIFPYAIAREMIDMSGGHGDYRDLETWDRIGKFISQKTPGTKAIGTGLALFGLANSESRDLETSISAFYRWRKDAMGFEEREDFLKEDKQKDFRTQMKKVVAALKAGDKAKFDEAFRSAVHFDGDTTKSLTARKILKTPKGKPLELKDMNALRDRIGDKAVDRLVHFDLMLEAAAHGEGLIH